MIDMMRPDTKLMSTIQGVINKCCARNIPLK